MTQAAPLHTLGPATPENEGQQKYVNDSTVPMTHAVGKKCIGGGTYTVGVVSKGGKWVITP